MPVLRSIGTWGGYGISPHICRNRLARVWLGCLDCGPNADDTESRTENISVAEKVQSNYRLSRELLETADTLRDCFPKALKLCQAYAGAAGQGTVVWRLPGTKEVAEEINELFNQIDLYEKEIAY